MIVPSRVFKNCVVTDARQEDALDVLWDLSHAERAEATRLGMADATVYREVAEGRAFALLLNVYPAETLAIFGATAGGSIWFLPTQTMVDKHWRILVDRDVISWVKQWQMSLCPERDLFFNGVTPEGKNIRKWLERYVGAHFLPGYTTAANGHPVYPFLMYREPAHVRT